MSESRELYYVGRRNLKGKLTHSFVKSPNDDTFTFFSKTKASVFGGCVIGACYKLGTNFPTSWREIQCGQVGADQAAQWQARDRAEYLHHTQKAVDPSPHLTAALKTINSARAAVPVTQRLAFDLWVMQEIRK